MALFVGEFDLLIDPKHRLAIPAPLREQMVGEDGKAFYLVQGPDKHLWLYPDQFFRRVLEPLQRSPFPSRKSQRLGLLFALARVVKPDAQGRVVLPEKCLQRAVIGEKVTLVGKGDHIELWPTEEWERFVVSALPDYGEELLDAGDGLEAPPPGDDK